VQSKIPLITGFRVLYISYYIDYFYHWYDALPLPADTYSLSEESHAIFDDERYDQGWGTRDLKATCGLPGP
jgi:hypothetical protein